jgi:hypothetical protein
VIACAAGRIDVLRKLGLALFAAAVLLTWAAGKGWFGEHEGRGEPAAQMRPEAARRAEADALREAATGIGVWKPKQILFGDLHVHTTFSLDAFLFSIPPIGGEGAHPPSDACDFARHCSALDFWSINDHAEGLTPAHWRETVEAIRQCNAVAGAGNPIRRFSAGNGRRWGRRRRITTATKRPARPRGRRDPARPISATGQCRRSSGRQHTALRSARALDIAGAPSTSRATSARRSSQALRRRVPVRELPLDCREQVAPAELFATR